MRIVIGGPYRENGSSRGKRPEPAVFAFGADQEIELHLVKEGDAVVLRIRGERIEVQERRQNGNRANGRHRGGQGELQKTVARSGNTHFGERIRGIRG